MSASFSKNVCYIFAPMSREQSDQGSYSLIWMKGRLPFNGWLVGSIQTQQLTQAYANVQAPKHFCCSHTQIMYNQCKICSVCS